MGTMISFDCGEEDFLIAATFLTDRKVPTNELATDFSSERVILGARVQLTDYPAVSFSFVC